MDAITTIRKHPKPKSTARDLRVLMLAHSHPKLTRGGAEVAAHLLFRGLKQAGVTTWFLGCSSKPGTGKFGIDLSQPFASDDYLYQSYGAFDWFKFANRNPEFPKLFSELLLELRPDIVHFHHYAQFGVEAFAIVKRVLPAAKVVLTLHEFLAICHNHGQMVKTQNYRLCGSETPIDCNACFPALDPSEFFLRKRYIQMFFDYVDLFIAPSNFLAERYAAWGLPRSKLIQLENVVAQPERPDLSDQLGTSVLRRAGQIRREKPQQQRVRAGFFGQMSPLKGIPVLLAAARELVKWKIDNIEIRIHGDYSNQPQEFQTVVVNGLAEVGENVKYYGPYDNTRVHELMDAMDVVIVPSIWWENSPVVIQEALACGKPVICSNIGGMAEKVRPGVDGLWFEAGNSLSLAQILGELADEPGLLARLAATAGRSPSAGEGVTAHLESYFSLVKGSEPAVGKRSS
jgi:glycosyltransferase involved in cell wall biosynthesis